MSTKSDWVITNGEITMTVCRTCSQPYREGHINCDCDQNHPDPCTRLTYDALLEISNARSRQIRHFIHELNGLYGSDIDESDITL